MGLPPKRANADDTFAKLLRMHAGCAAGVRRFVIRISASGGLGPGPSLRRNRALAQGLARWGSRRATGSPIVGANRPRLYWSIAAAQMLGAVPVPVYADSVADEIALVLDHAGAKFIAAQDQEQVDKIFSVADRLPNLALVIYDEERGLGDYERAAAALARGGDRRRPRRARRRWTRGRARRAHQRRRGQRPVGDPLHLGHDGAIEGRRAERRALHRGGARHRRLRQSDRSRRGAGLSAARLGRRSLSQLRARPRRGILHGLPGKRRHRRRRLARDRPDVPFRAAARVRGAADAGDDPHGGRERAQALAVPSLHGRRAALGREHRQPANACPGSRGCTMRSASC